jgi:prepilin-type N-terminal cleavage/methylation domain-containing protein
MQLPFLNMRGFTLIEMLVVIGITGTVGMALTTLIVNFYKTNGYLLQEASAIDSAHRGLEISFTNLRQASYGDDGSYPILSAATSSITFFSDIDGDGSVEKIRLYLLQGTFYRGVTDSTSSPPVYTGQKEATTTIATYVRNATPTPLFRYFDINNTELSTTTAVDVSKITSVSTSVMVDLNPLRAPDILTLQETATLRNLR